MANECSRRQTTFYRENTDNNEFMSYGPFFSNMQNVLWNSSNDLLWSEPLPWIFVQIISHITIPDPPKASDNQRWNIYFFGRRKDEEWRNKNLEDCLTRRFGVILFSRGNVRNLLSCVASWFIFRFTMAHFPTYSFKKVRYLPQTHIRLKWSQMTNSCAPATNGEICLTNITTRNRFDAGQTVCSEFPECR